MSSTYGDETPSRTDQRAARRHLSDAATLHRLERLVGVVVGQERPAAEREGAVAPEHEPSAVRGAVGVGLRRRAADDRNGEGR